MDSKAEQRRRRVAGWIGIPSISVWGMFKALEWLFGLGGASGNAEGWRTAVLVMLSVMPSWLMPALLVGGGVALVIYLVGIVPESYGKARHRVLMLWETPEGIKRLSMIINIAIGAVAISVFGPLFYYLFVVYEPPAEPVWIHPDMSEQERRVIMAECRMKAFEAIGGGDLGTKPGDRREYVSECLTAEGFVLR